MCTSPQTIFVRARHLGVSAGSYVVPCGHCAECMAAKQNSWMVRMIEQLKDTPDAWFLTFTYSDAHVPVSVDLSTGECWLSVCKSHMQKWMKRLKIGLVRSGRDFKSRPLHYFITSEYGMHPKKHKRDFRPHYHAILFGITKKELMPYLQDWRNRFGFVTYSQVRSSVACSKYCSKYCAKGMFENPLVAEGKVAPTFHLVSHGLGVGYIKRMRSFHLTAPAGIKKRVDACQIYYSKRYVEFVVDNLYYRNQQLYDSYRNKAVKIALPRYYKERILGHSIYIAGSDSKKGKTVVCKSLLQKQVADFLFQRRVERFDDQCREFVESGIAKSYSEAIFLVKKTEVESLAERERVARERLYKFYQKSKF